MKIDPDSQAFPFSAVGNRYFTGLTIRAEFAKAAMMGLQANPELIGETVEEMAIHAVDAADELIARLNQDEP